MPTETAAPAPLTGGSLALITVALALAVFMNVLDVSIANVSIPTIAGDLAVSSNQGTWIITSFSVSNAIAVPLSGWLAKRFGEVRLFVACTLLFVLTSWCCGLAPTFGMLLLSRTLQGAVAGPMIPLSQSLLLANYPADRRGFANGVWGMTAVVGPVAGPILGGWITDNIQWSWIFYINIPVGLVAAAITWAMLKDRETERAKLPIDTIGLALLIVAVASLQIMLDRGNDEAWFQSDTIWTLSIISFITFAFWIVWELTDDNPVVNLRLFGKLNFTVATIAVTLGYMAYFGGVVVFPLWLQNQMDYTATWAGIATSSLGVMGIIGSPIVGRLTDKFDLRVIVTVGMLTFSGLSFLYSNVNTDITFGMLYLERLPWGLGLACFFIPLITMSLSGLPGDQVASASGLFNFMRLLALGFGTNLSTALWYRRDSIHDHRLNDAVTATSQTTQQWLERAHELGMSHGAALQELAHTITRQAYAMATADVFWLSGWLFLLLTVLVWFARPPFQAPGGAVVAEG